MSSKAAKHAAFDPPGARRDLPRTKAVTTIPSTARVEEVIYLGDHIRTRMTVAGNSDFIVKTRNRLGATRLDAGSKRCGSAGPRKIAARSIPNDG